MQSRIYRNFLTFGFHREKLGGQDAYHDPYATDYGSGNYGYDGYDYGYDGYDYGYDGYDSYDSYGYDQLGVAGDSADAYGAPEAGPVGGSAAATWSFRDRERENNSKNNCIWKMHLYVKV